MLIGMPCKQFDAPSSNSKHGHLVLGEIVGEMAFELGDLELSGYIPGVVGKITEAHGTYYYEHWGFDVTFETQVGRELSEFLIDFHDRRDGAMRRARAHGYGGLSWHRSCREGESGGPC